MLQAVGKGTIGRETDLAMQLLFVLRETVYGQQEVKGSEKLCFLKLHSAFMKAYPNQEHDVGCGANSEHYQSEDCSMVLGAAAWSAAPYTRRQRCKPVSAASGPGTNLPHMFAACCACVSRMM